MKYKRKPPVLEPDHWEKRASRFIWKPEDLIIFKSDEEYQEYCKTHKVIKYNEEQE